MNMLCVLVLVLVVLGNAVPSFDIHLETAPELRWKDVNKYYMKDILAMGEKFNSTLLNKFSETELQSWTEALKLKLPAEFAAEMQGISNDINSPFWTFDRVLLFNNLYELESPTLCSGVLAAQPDGTVIHGRNMDYQFLFPMPDGSTHDWPDVTFDVNLWREGEKIATIVTWPLWIGVHTGMRYNGWTFEQNTRHTNNHSLNLEAAKQGALPFGLMIRHMLQTIPTFQEATEKIESTNFMAPQYFIMSGAQPWEGAVFTMDRGGKRLPGTPPVARIGQVAGAWHLLQTNDDTNNPTWWDPRRPLTEILLATKHQYEVNEDFVWDVIRSYTLFNPLSAFTWVANSRTGYHETIVHSEAPPKHALVQDSSAVADSRSIKMSEEWRKLAEWPMQRLQMFQSAGAGSF